MQVLVERAELPGARKLVLVGGVEGNEAVLEPGQPAVFQAPAGSAFSLLCMELFGTLYNLSFARTFP